MKRKMAVFGVGLFLALSAPVVPTMAAETTLHIPPVFQERLSWSWAAVGEMVFKYYYVPAAHRTDYQCGIAQERKLCMGTPNCSECDLPAGDEASMVRMLEQYPVMASPGGTAGDIALTVQSKAGSLSELEVKKRSMRAVLLLLESLRPGSRWMESLNIWPSSLAMMIAPAP